MTRPIDRRSFLLSGAAAGGYFLAAPALSAARVLNANDRLRFAGIGVGGKGSSDIDQAGEFGDVTAICDVDERQLNSKSKKFPSAKRFFDYRKMLEEMGKEIDAVTISGPDHMHAHAAVTAMRMKKHAYVQKPLTHDVFEARLLREEAKKNAVQTQMGNQGTAENGLRRAVELVQGDTIGKVLEIHVWTNRPVWPQAPEVMERPKGKAEAPKEVKWDLFLNTAPERPYAPGYHPFNWRGWWDFGTGALGDMACHTANMAFMACKLGHPTRVSAEAKDLNPETCPTWARVVYDFPARGDNMPALKFYWYEGREGGRQNKGGKRILPPDSLLTKILSPQEFEARNAKLAASGSIIVGDKGILFSPNDYGAAFVLLPKEEFEKVNTKRPEKLPVNNGGDTGMKREWVEAIKGGPAPVSNFDYAGMLTEAILLGNVAIRAGKAIEWDGPGCKVTNDAKANDFVRREYRKGWEI